MKKFTLFLSVAAASTCAFAANAPKSAAQYYSDAAFQYIQNRLPTAEITCKEGLSYYPDDAKLQMLQDRIEESKDEQQKQNQQNNPKNENQNQDQNQDQQNQQNQNQDQQNQDQNQNGSSSSNENDSENGSSDSQGANSSDSQSSNSQSSNSQGGDGNSSNSNEQEQPEQPQGGNENPEEVPPGQMTPQQASQLLKDFDAEHGERKPWKPVRGQARPEKDW